VSGEEDIGGEKSATPSKLRVFCWAVVSIFVPITKKTDFFVVDKKLIANFAARKTE